MRGELVDWCNEDDFDFGHSIFNPLADQSLIMTVTWYIGDQGVILILFMEVSVPWQILA